MKKKLCTALLSCVVGTAMAGGLVTNTNQNAAFLRQLSQESIIDITGLYANPAGTAFLGKGFHASVNIQNAKQSRDITTTYPLMAYNVNERNESRAYSGEAYAPVIPSIQLSYNWERWSVNAAFAVSGGGGACEFNNGLGTFESMYSAALYSAALSQVIPGVNAAVTQGTGGVNPDYKYAGYSLDAYMKGAQYQYGITIGATYKILENLSGFVGLRGVIASNSYNGYVKGVNVHLAAQSPAFATGSSYYEALKNYASYTYPLADNELSLNCDQKGFGVTPIIGLDWRINEQWNVAAKYEGRTKLVVKNESKMNAYTSGMAASNATLGQFADGGEVRCDIPGIVTAGVQYTPLKALRLQAGSHYYFDKQAKQYGDKQELLAHGTWELNAGVEYDICRYVTASAGWQITQYGLTDAYMNDLSFVTNSNSLGVGVRVNIIKQLSVDLAYMHTFYQTKDVVTDNYLGSGQSKSDSYFRKNRVLGLGVNLAF